VHQTLLTRWSQKKWGKTLLGEQNLSIESNRGAIRYPPYSADRIRELFLFQNLGHHRTQRCWQAHLSAATTTHVSKDCRGPTLYHTSYIPILLLQFNNPTPLNQSKNSAMAFDTWHTLLSLAHARSLCYSLRLLSTQMKMLRFRSSARQAMGDQLVHRVPKYAHRSTPGVVSTRILRVPI
jgi:hypothetical protein